MLHLAHPTDPGWFDRVHDHLPTLLLDHTHLEKRAASTAMSLLFRYAKDPVLALALSEVVREEMEHFARLVELLGQRGIALDVLEPAPYASLLNKACQRKDPEALLDKLLACSLIEARSCERFQILAERLSEPALRALYDQLYKDEARHYTLYVTLAHQLFDPAQVNSRLEHLAGAEYQALLDSKGPPRLHCF